MSLVLRRLSAAGFSRHLCGACAVLAAIGMLPVSAVAQPLPLPQPPGVEQQPPTAGDPPTVEDPLAPEAIRPPVAPKPVPRRLDLNMSLFEGYDLTSVTAGLPGLLEDPHLQEDLAFSGFSTSLSYSQIGDRRTFGALAGTDLRYYSLAPTLLPINFYGGVNFSTALRRRLRFTGSQTVGYSPFYSFGDFLTPSAPLTIRAPGTDRGVARLRTVTSSSAASLSAQLSRKASLTGRYSFDYIGTPNSYYRVVSQGAYGSFQYRATRHLMTRLGYGYYTSQLAAQSSLFRVQNIDAGLGYQRPLSFSRHTVVGFNFGTALLTAGPSRYFTVTGDASLAHQVSRTWTASVVYNRSLGTVGGLTVPFVSDVVSASIGGLATRRLAISMSGGFARGGAAIGQANSYDAITAGGRLSYPLTRYMPVYVEYIYYFYQFEQSAGLAPGFPIFVQRHGIRSGLSYSLPLIGRRPGQR